jgi:SAM-dependent methyltransferase
MGVGSAVRSRLGRLENPAIRLYRGVFISVGDLARTLSSTVDSPVLVGEIGCGDGVVINALMETWPTTEFIGVDPAPTVGRLFAGDSRRVRFQVATSADLLDEYENKFDVTLIVDVVHHVADSERATVLQEAARLTVPGGVVVFKEWELRRGPAHLVAYCADRFVSGDANVRFMKRAELESLVERAMPGWETVLHTRIRPRWNNTLWVLRKPI